MNIEQLLIISDALNEAYTGELYKSKVAINPDVALHKAGYTDYHWSTLPTMHKMQLLNHMYASGQKLRKHIVELKAKEAAQRSVNKKTGEPVFADGELDKLTGRLLSGFKQIKALIKSISDEIDQETSDLEKPTH